MTLNESPSEKEGKYRHPKKRTIDMSALNESPSEKEGKYQSRRKWQRRFRRPQ